MEKRALKESVYCGAKYTRSQQRGSGRLLAKASLFNFAEAEIAYGIISIGPVRPQGDGGREAITRQSPKFPLVKTP